MATESKKEENSVNKDINKKEETLSRSKRKMNEKRNERKSWRNEEKDKCIYGETLEGEKIFMDSKSRKAKAQVEVGEGRLGVAAKKGCRMPTNGIREIGLTNEPAAFWRALE